MVGVYGFEGDERLGEISERVCREIGADWCCGILTFGIVRFYFDDPPAPGIDIPVDAVLGYFGGDQ